MIAVSSQQWVRVQLLIATLCALSCAFCIIESRFPTFTESDLYRFSIAREAVDAVGLFLARVPVVLMAYAIARLCLPDRLEDASSLFAILAGIATLCGTLYTIWRFTGLSVFVFNELSTGLMIIQFHTITWATCVSYPSAIASGLSEAIKSCVLKWGGLFIPLSIFGLILTTGVLYRIENFYFEHMQIEGFHPVFATHSLRTGVKWMCICLCYFNQRTCPSWGERCQIYLLLVLLECGLPSFELDVGNGLLETTRGFVDSLVWMLVAESLNWIVSERSRSRPTRTKKHRHSD